MTVSLCGVALAQLIGPARANAQQPAPKLSIAGAAGISIPSTPISTSPRRSFSNSSFSVQAVAGLEVALTSHVAAFGQYQFLAPTIDIAAGQATVGAGVRVRLW